MTSERRDSPLPAKDHYEIDILIGPCSEVECETLMEVIADLPETKAVGGVVSSGPWTEDEPPVASEREEWERAYDEAAQSRDWQTCEILIDERATSDWYWEGERDDAAGTSADDRHEATEQRPSNATSSPLRLVWRAIRDFVAPDLRGKLAALDDEKLILLQQRIYGNPRGVKDVHVRMVADECARRGL